MSNSGLTYLVFEDISTGNSPHQTLLSTTFNSYEDAIALAETWIQIFSLNSGNVILYLYSWNNQSYKYTKIPGNIVTKVEIAFPSYI